MRFPFLFCISTFFAGSAHFRLFFFPPLALSCSRVFLTAASRLYVETPKTNMHMTKRRRNICVTKLLTVSWTCGIGFSEMSRNDAAARARFACCGSAKARRVANRNNKKRSFSCFFFCRLLATERKHEKWFFRGGPLSSDA